MLDLEESFIVTQENMDETYNNIQNNNNNNGNNIGYMSC